MNWCEAHMHERVYACQMIRSFSTHLNITSKSARDFLQLPRPHAYTMHTYAHWQSARSCIDARLQWICEICVLRRAHISIEKWVARNYKCCLDGDSNTAIAVSAVAEWTNERWIIIDDICAVFWLWIVRIMNTTTFVFIRRHTNPYADKGMKTDIDNVLFDDIYLRHTWSSQ